MKKKHSILFWIFFWLVSGCFLLGWYLFLKVKDEGFRGLGTISNILPVSQEMKGELQSVLSLADFFISQKGRTLTFLVLFQNNWELRPGGGYIGSFGILKIRDGRIEDIEVHDTSNFDGRIPPTVEAPYPMKQTLNIDSWKLRDSNYSPDFPTNAKQAIYFYQLGKGEESFDGVIAVTANVLSSVIGITGSVYLPSYDKTFSKDTAIETLEYQVEKGFEDRNIAMGDRKGVMRELAEVLAGKLQEISLSKKIELAQMAHELLSQKDIQLYFNDTEAEKIVAERGWGGSVDSLWQNDFFMAVDANLGAFKSDAKIKRSVKYSVDFSSEKPKVTVVLSYKHTAQQKDWMTKEYISYTRIYVPAGSWLLSADGIDVNSVRYGDEFGKKYFGFLFYVPLAQEKTVTLHYALPKSISARWYDLKIQKQSGVRDVPYVVFIADDFGNEKEYSFSLNDDILLSNMKK